MVQVAAGGGPAAAGCGAPGVAGADNVAEFAAGPVAGLRVVVLAATAGDRGHRDAHASDPVPRPGAGRRSGRVHRRVRELWWGWWCRAAGVAAGCAAVGGGGAVGVQRGDTPPGAGVAGRRGGQAASVGRVDNAVPADLGWGSGLAGRADHGTVMVTSAARLGPASAPAWSPWPVPPGPPRDRGLDRDDRRRHPGRCRRSVRAAAVSGRADVLRAGRGRRPGRAWDGREAGAPLLKQIQVGPDAELFQGAGDPGGAQVQRPLLHMLPGSEHLIAGQFPGDHPGVPGRLPERLHVRVPPPGLLPPRRRLRVQFQDQPVRRGAQFPERQRPGLSASAASAVAASCGGQDLGLLLDDPQVHRMHAPAYSAARHRGSLAATEVA